MFAGLRQRLARMIWPHATVQRMYASARPSRVSPMPSTSSSADQELATSLRAMRSHSRQLCRDASFAKRAKVVVMNNVIGSGIGLQSQVKTTRGELNKAVNDAIEEAFEEWSCAEYCHTGGVMHFHDLERALMSEVFEAGEAFIRLHYRAFGTSKVPLALELVEPERVAEEVHPSPAARDNLVRLGVEVDTFYRPVRYWTRERHQNEYNLVTPKVDRYLPVPADEIIHLRVAERWPQTRGVPWLHTVISKLRDIDGYSEAEIIAARGAANYMAWVKTPEDPRSPLAGAMTPGTTGQAAQKTVEIAPGLVVHLGAGEEMNFVSPNRPNSAMDPFLRMMLREVAAGCGTSYESLSRDYSQSNYSSSRLALLDDRDLWRVVQQWFIRSFRQKLHPIFLQQAILAEAIPAIPLTAYATDMRRYCAARYKPRGWTWIDPTKEVQAYKEAVRCGFTTTTDVIAKTGDGLDIEDVLEGRSQELEQMHELGLEFDTDPERAADGKPADEPAAPPTTEDPPGSAGTATDNEPRSGGVRLLRR